MFNAANYVHWWLVITPTWEVKAILLSEVAEREYLDLNCLGFEGSDERAASQRLIDECRSELRRRGAR